MTESLHGDLPGRQTPRTYERHPGHHCKEPCVDPSHGKGKVVQKLEPKMNIGPFKIKSSDLNDSNLELFSYIFRSNNSRR